MLSSPISKTLFFPLFRDALHVTVAKPLSIPNATSKLVSVNVKKESLDKNVIDARWAIGIWVLTDVKNAVVIPILPLAGDAIHSPVNANVCPE